MKRNEFLKNIVGTLALAIIPSTELMAIKDKVTKGYWYNELNKLYKEMGEYLISIMKPGVFYHSKHREDIEFDAFISDNWGRFTEIVINKEQNRTMIHNEPLTNYSGLIMDIARVSEIENKPVKDWEPIRIQQLDKIRRFVREKVKQGEHRYPYTKLVTFTSSRTGDHIEIGTICDGGDMDLQIDIDDNTSDMIALFADNL